MSAEPVSAADRTSYLGLSRDGRGDGGHYLLGLLVILFTWLIAGSLLAGGLQAVLGGPTGATGWRSLIVDLAPFILLAAGVLLTVRWVLQRPALTVITALSRVSVRRMLVGAGAWAAIIAVASAIDWLVAPEAYTFTFSLATFVPAAVVLLLLIPVQAGAEEMLFRGYLMQWSALGVDRRGRPPRPPLVRVAILAAVSGVLFGVPHLLNPEAQGAQAYAWLYWFFLGAGWAWACVLDGRAELAIGAHIANNLFATLVVSYSGGSLAVAGIWSTGELNIPLSILTAAIASVLFVLLTCRGLRPRAETS